MSKWSLFIETAFCFPYNNYMKTLYFIRHAESEANKNRILASRLPFPLTSEGKADSKRIAADLRKITILDSIISSPLKRAVQTAESFSEMFDIKIRIDDRITEQNLGRYSGMSYDEIKKFSDYEQDPLNRWNWLPAGGGESYSMIADRVCSFLKDLEKEESNHILIVTHAVALRLIIGALTRTLPVYPKDFPNNGEIIKVDFTSLADRHELRSIFLGNSKNFTHNP